MEEGFKFYVRPRGAGIGNSRHRADRPLNHGEGARPSTIVGYRLPAFDTAEYKIFERRGLEEKLQSWIEKRKATFLENKSRTGSSVLTLSEAQIELFNGLIKYTLSDLVDAPNELKAIYDSAVRIGPEQKVREINNLAIQYMLIMDGCLDKENESFVKTVLKTYHKASSRNINGFMRSAKRLRHIAKRINKSAQEYLDLIQKA